MRQPISRKICQGRPRGEFPALLVQGGTDEPDDQEIRPKIDQPAKRTLFSQTSSITECRGFRILWPRAMFQNLMALRPCFSLVLLW